MKCFTTGPYTVFSTFMSFQILMHGDEVKHLRIRLKLNCSIFLSYRRKGEIRYQGVPQQLNEQRM
jgi:hypothetical protein